MLLGLGADDRLDLLSLLDSIQRKLLYLWSRWLLRLLGCLGPVLVLTTDQVLCKTNLTRLFVLLRLHLNSWLYCLLGF